MDNCGDGSDQASWPPANCGGQSGVGPGPRRAAGMGAGGRGVAGEDKGKQQGLCPDQAEDL